ncbi:tetratricopeptide repeat protein [Aquimarina sp. ERC-38]|uniref:tetratricopeptide repeat protein n=1 Tax=Aquimarina sp. ERC-38 TaxID=2949996 RepID=UPI002245F705|nr:tetratricopeptide repeat protein [Aquimarina sp. ERC-38]UZO81343.1 tetratricopeptide repeat protein [Aquimarina sp. ERC-38]
MRFLLIFIFLWFSVSVSGQSEQLAKNYMQQGSYEKALSVYKKLYENSPNRINYILGVVSSHQQLEQFEEAEVILNLQLEKNPNNLLFLVELGHHFELQQKKELANQYYQKAITGFDENNINQVFSLGQTFEKYSLLDQAAIIYERGMKANPGSSFNVQLAKIYGEQGKTEEMLEKYLSLILEQPNYRNVVQRNISEYINEDPENEANLAFKKVLLKRLQQNPDILYNEMLSWLFVQQKEFKKAFIQEKAIYKRTEQGLDNILNLARTAIQQEDLKSATLILNYVLESTASKDLKLKAHKIILKAETETAQQQDYQKIEEKYKQVFEIYGKSRETIGLQTDYAHFIAFYQDRKKEAITFLKRLLKELALSRFQSARVKMEMADILVLDQKFNQALIYYTQVQNTLKNNFLAQDARFKVAKTSYYKGDFKWAQTQLDVLKSSATQLIANDAMELSLIISDNSFEDSTQTALKIFARGDLLTFQQKNQEAISVYEQILTDHKGEKIEDEAFFRQAQLYEKEKMYDKAKLNYQKIIEFYPTDILVDDAYYALANLYTSVYNEPEKAKELYERIIFNHANSIYYVDARKKYRMLRGDAIE